MSEQTFREKIEEIIKESGSDTSTAAINICILLDDEIGLIGNGWFDDDDELRKLICDW